MVFIDGLHRSTGRVPGISISAKGAAFQWPAWGKAQEFEQRQIASADSANQGPQFVRDGQPTL
jgi:hypothetical protein